MADVSRNAFDRGKHPDRTGETPREQRRPAKDLLDRPLGALYGAVSGDSTGAPTRFLSRARIGRLLLPSAGPDALPDGVLAEALTTPNVDLGRIVADLLVEGHGSIDEGALRSALARWLRADRQGAGRIDPAIAAALGGLDGAPESGWYGDTNSCLPGAIVVGVATRPAPVAGLIDRVEEICRPTHDTGLAIAGASAVAAAISAGIEGAALVRALEAGEQAAALGAGRGRFVPGASVAERIDWALELVAASGTERSLALVSELVGTGVRVQETVPAAFALALLWPDDPWRVCLEAARLGGDTSSVGASAAAIVGSVTGLRAFPPEAAPFLSGVNRQRLRDVAQDLVRLRLHEAEA